MKKILIANRGEIALRIIRSARDCAIQSVAIYADDDMDAPFVRFADKAYALKGNTPTDTYLNIEKILDIAKKAKVDAVHPGYGFLSERADFAQAVLDAGLLWIGPKPEVIEQLGDKVQARHIAQSVGAPLVAGTPGPVNSAQEVLEFTKTYGFPIAIKAAYGGGGRGLKVVREAHDVVNAFESAVREAVAAFGRGECYVEQFLDRPRHVEAQVIADQHGNVIVLGTRDCSLQRRNQKLVEEAPAPFLSQKQRKEIHDAAEAICKKAGYTGAGTVEFLLGSNGVISFLEVNTRLQVEHPVTEETSGIDLVAEQFRIAEGKELSIKTAPEPRGHSIEFRINAEDAGRGFLPSPGLITCFEPPSGPGVRVDSGVVTGSAIAPMFDSMMAKLIVTGKDRQEAICRARRALKEFKIEGVASVLNFHQAVIENEDFTAENGFKVHTRWIETDFDNQLQMLARSEPIKTDMQRCMIEIDGKRMELGLPAAFFRQMGNTTNNDNSQTREKTSYSKNDILAPVPGVIRVWNVKTGDSVKEGDTLGLMEAMKMETAILAPLSGIINITVEAGETASPDTIIATIKE